MFSIFKSNPTKKLEKEYRQMLEKARDIQRSGDLRLYAKVMEESEELWRKIESMKQQEKK